MFPQMVNNNNNNGDGAIFLLAMVGCGLLAAVLMIHILHMISLSRCLQQVRPRNRNMEPAHVWFSLIPIFNVVWVFIVVNRVASSLRREYRDRRWSSRGEDFGQTLGITYYDQMMIIIDDRRSDNNILFLSRCVSKGTHENLVLA